MSEITKNEWQNLTSEYGPAFYLLDTEQFRQNFLELKEAFSSFYPNFNIAYSYKTNYTPKLCKIIDELGGYAEVVSAMELELARRLGVPAGRIIWNGPYKNRAQVEEFLLAGGTVNIDAAYEFAMIRDLATRHQAKELHIGIRANFDINYGGISRFGLDVESDLFREVLAYLQHQENIHFSGIQCHFAPRNLKSWQERVKGIVELLEKFSLIPEHLDLGGGLFGKMPPSLSAQFGGRVPTYKEYAQVVAKPLARFLEKSATPPLLLIEPGSALVGDVLKFVASVINIKTVRGKDIATVAGSIYNINPTLNKKNPPLEIIPMGGEPKEYQDLDFGGYTCIESDYIYRHYAGSLAVGDLAVFGNGGSYSIVLKPPFILPNFPVLEYHGPASKPEVIKRGECFDDLFHTFSF